MDFGPIITQNGCIRFVYPEGMCCGGYFNFDGGTYTMMVCTDETITSSYEYDMETLKQIPGLKNEVKDGIMTLKYREYGFKLNIKFKVDPLMYFPQLSKNKNAVILQTKHIDNIENITTFGIYIYDFKGVMLHSILDTSLDKSDYYYYESYSIIHNNDQDMYIWDHIKNKLIHILESHYNEITYIGYDQHYDLFIILVLDDDSENLTILYVNKIKPSEYLLRTLPYLHDLCDKYIKPQRLAYRFVQIHGYKYKLLSCMGKTLNNKQIAIVDPVKLQIIKEIEYIGYDHIYSVVQIGDKLIYNSKNDSSEENVYMVVDLNKGTEKPLKDYIPEDQLLDMPINSIHPVGLNKCWLTYCGMEYLEHKIVDFNH
jgi:hypothetical protein